MNRNKRIIDCTPGEIVSLGKQLIDYYFERKKYIEDPISAIRELAKQCKFNFEEGETICQDQKGL